MKIPRLLPKNQLFNQGCRLLTTILLVGTIIPNYANLTAQTINKKTEQIQILNQADYSYSESINSTTPAFQGISPQVINKVTRLVDPFGTVTGCAGELLPDYNGFSIGLYEVLPSDATGTNLGKLVSLTTTEFPDMVGNNLPGGAKPNTQNNNPFFLTNSDRGTYNFLFDPERGQLDQGRTYILLVNPAPKSIYDQRRIKITIGSRNGDAVNYTATSLDGKPISATDNSTSVNGTIDIQNAERTGLSLAVLDLSASICQAQEIQIIKTGDRAAAEPGDTVIYRLAIKNLASAPLNNIAITDTLPVGFNFLSKSVRAEFNGTQVPIVASNNGSTITLTASNFSLPASRGSQEQTFTIAYAAVLTPDAIRGSGENSAVVNGQRVDNRREVKDGPSIHRLRIQPGIITDCGTLIGRVFVDKNFDGEQQANEPGIPNAVVFMDDGNRIITDPNGLFSVANVISGYRTAVLDLTSVPGYTFARNSRFKERNSQSRLVHLEPGGLARVNFAVTPTFGEEKQP